MTEVSSTGTGERRLLADMSRRAAGGRAPQPMLAPPCAGLSLPRHISSGSTLV